MKYAPNVWADLGPEWGRCLISMGTVDPYDAYRPAKPKRLPNPLAVDRPPTINARAFAARAIVERARLALVDPIGEAEAAAPLSHADAIRILQRYATPATAEISAVRRTVGHGRQSFDPRELLDKLHAEPAPATSGRVPCPGHGGDDANLAWRLAGDKVLLHCWSHQCSFESIVKAVA